MKIDELFPDKLPQDSQVIVELPEDFQVIVELPEDLIAESALLNEGAWTESGRKDLMCRVDAARPEMKQRRHVHVAHKKHVTAKNQQAAWNDDGSRHDKSSFNEKFGGRKTVQTVAREALGLDDSIVLEDATLPSGLLMEDVHDQRDDVPFLRVPAAC